MAIRRRISGYSGLRIDLPHLRSIESSVSNDFDDLLRGLVTGLNRPLLVRGFKLKIPTSAVPASTLQISVADSVILHSSATESGTILTVPPGTPDEILDASNAKVIGAFQSGVINYVSLDYRRVTDTATTDNTAGWSPSQQIEFQRAAPLGRILEYRFIISTAGFSTNLPLYIIKVASNGNVEYMVDARQRLGRLGSGGASPNPQYKYNFGGLINPQTGNRREWINTDASIPYSRGVAPGAPIDAFDYGDNAIGSLKDLLDAIMTRFCEITGSPLWYIDSGFINGGLNLQDLWWDSIGSVMTGSGAMSYNMILEADHPTEGLFQSKFTDSTIQANDSYVEGFTSGTRAILSTFNNSQLIINSLTPSAFIFDEVLYNRRKFRPDLSKYLLSDIVYSSTRWARLRRTPTSTGATANITSWTYNNVIGADLFYSTITITTTTPHGYSVGDLVNIYGLTLPVDLPPNGVYMVEEVVSPTVFTFRYPFPLTGAPGVLPPASNGTKLDSSEYQPYLPRFTISSWSYSGTTAKLIIPMHNFKGSFALTGDTTNGSQIITNLPTTENIKLGMTISGAGIPADSIVTDIISLTSIEISQAATATAIGVTLTFKEQIVVSGLTATTNAPNGILSIDSLGPGANEVNVTLAAAPTGPAGVSNAIARPFAHKFILSVSGSNRAPYNLTNVPAITANETWLRYAMGPDTIPPQSNAGGLIEFDGVIAVSKVLNPVKVATITNDGSGNLTITTTTPHGLITNPGPLTFTIFGNPNHSIYIRTYQNVGINVINATQFVLQNTGIVSTVSYTNPGHHNTFIKFENNPYAGPVQWDSDIIIKGIISDKFFRIPVTATAATTVDDPDVSPIANQFNTGSVTGTVYLQDGEVAFIKLKRNLLVSNGSTYSTIGGSTVVGSTPPVDENGINLVAGDFVKWEDEPESRWIRIAGTPGTPITTNTFTLVDDRGQSPSLSQRPPKVGKLVYAKGIYDKIFVKKHWQVDLSKDIYWLAVRRDNGSLKSKVYLRDLELEAGEVRQINDNEPSNLLRYTGANHESAINPNYSVCQSSGPYQFTQNLTIEDIDIKTRMVTFVSGPDLHFARNDRIVKTVGSNTYTLTVRHTLSSRTVVFNEDVSVLAVSDVVQYQRMNYQLEDADNLTLGLRKEDRELAKVDTALNRPIYDETVFIQRIDLGGTGTIRSGSYIYKGPQDNPTALAWVLHGTDPVVETIETAPVTMPGGHVSIGSNAILVHIISGTFNDGDTLSQNGVVTSRTVDNPGNPPFPAPSVAAGVEIVLPPNRRTQVFGTQYLVFGTHSYYKASSDPNLSGEELYVIMNGLAKYVDLDYEETFGGPKAKIKFLQATPSSCRLRCRILPAYGSSLAAKAGDVTLQSAYNGGRIINEVVNLPIEINASNPSLGEVAIKLAGSLEINGGPTQLGGIFGDTDQNFVIGREDNKPKSIWSGLQAIKTHGSHPDSAVYRKTAAQTVVGDTPTVITGSAVTLNDGRAIRVKILATVRRTDGPHGVASFGIEGTFYREGGSPTPAGYPISDMYGASGDGFNYSLVFGILGNDIVAVAEGSAGATTQWSLTIEWQSVGLSS